MKAIGKTGDIFRIDLKDGFCIGQIFHHDKYSLYVGIFGRVFQEGEFTPELLDGLEPVFAGETLDALFFHKRWKIIDNYKNNLSSICKPNYKVRYNGVQHLETFDRQLIRTLSEEEELKFRNREVSAPILYDKATKAYFGDEEWKLYYEDIKYDYPKMSSKIV